MSLFGTFAELRHASSVGTLYAQGLRCPYWKDLEVCNMMGSLGSLLGWVAPLGRLQSWCL